MLEVFFVVEHEVEKRDLPLELKFVLVLADGVALPFFLGGVGFTC